MKQFGIIFSAVLAAIFAAIFVISAWVSINSWESSKEARLGFLDKAEAQLRDSQALLSKYPDNTEMIRVINRAVESEESTIAMEHLNLIHIFDKKWWFLSSDEQAQREQFSQSVAEYRSQHPDKEIRSFY